MLTLTQNQLRAVLLARGDDPRPFTKALWITERFVMCTNGHRMHLLTHRQDWVHGNVAVPFGVLPTDGAVAFGRNMVAGKPFLPVMGATLPPVDKFLPKLPAAPVVGPLRCAVNPKYLQDAHDAIGLAAGEGQDLCLHMTPENVWAWSDGQLLVCISPLLDKGQPVQLKGI